MTDIKQLLATYESSYVPGEKRSNKYNNRKKIEAKIRSRIRLLHQLLQVLPESLLLNKDQVMLCENLVKTFINFKYLHRQASEETILLAFIFYQLKLDKPGIKIEKYTISHKYKLTTSVYVNIVSRIANYYMLNSPLNIKQTTAYDHDLLIKNGGA